MLYNNPSQINLSKYKRLFTFGCSFTKYRWPTWSTLLHKSMPHAEYYNTGKSGGGQTYIANQLVQYNLNYKFEETDLVVIMLSTFFREDRYKYCGEGNDGWLTPGNIFTQQMYDEKFIINWADTRGYIIRDLSLISGMIELLKSVPADSVILSSVPVNSYNELTLETPPIDDILDLHKDSIEYIQKPMLELEMDNFWEHGCHYKMNGSMMNDYHPNTLRYCNYLEKVGFTLSDSAKTYAKDCADILANDIQTFDDLVNRWGHEHEEQQSLYKPII
jgi:hypothetical protein